MRMWSARSAALWVIGAAAVGFLAGVVFTSEPVRIASRLDGEARAQRPGANDGGLDGVRPPVNAPREAPAPPAVAQAAAIAPPAVAAEAIEDLRKRHLTLPVEGLERESLRDTFNEERGADRRHEALDILAPRDTPVRAVEDGTVAKLFLSVPGGITVYQFDPGSTYAYYYAHLARYAEGLKEGAAVARGQTLGYVGTTGNAPPGTPHLHFAIFKLTDEKQWWRGLAIDPYQVFK
jgi:murein DD-endopeptidase MepM/ murein hydrolase activator NlpD